MICSITKKDEEGYEKVARCYKNCFRTRPVEVCLEKSKEFKDKCDKI